MINKKALIKKDAQNYADCAIGFVKSSPCCICANELPNHSCWGGYINKGAWPIYKNLKRRLSVLEVFESEAEDNGN